MKKTNVLKIVIMATTTVGIVAGVAKKRAENETYTAELMEPIVQRKQGIYEKYIKRGLDVLCAAGAIVFFSPVYIGVATLVRLKLGSPILFTQDRPGMIGSDGKERIFRMYKFRTMTDERDEEGNLLPDEVRLTKFGAWLRSTSLDELPEAFNILNGTMSVIGPRPQLVRDMVFMTKAQRERHTSRPGMSGLAQIKGRNSISWEEKIQWDLHYINNISFINDIKCIIETVKVAFFRQDGITDGENATALDYGDALLKENSISIDEYREKQQLARNMNPEGKQHRITKGM